jgi:hypothetical protein
MSRLLEFFLGSILITVFTVAAMFFFALQHLLRIGGFGDCVWQASARTWIDADGDGQLSPGEGPLSDVRVHVDDIENQLADVSWPGTTGKEGKVQLLVPIPGCEETLFEIYVDIPEGYGMTTRSRIEVHPGLRGSLRAERVYYFGFEALR